MHPSNRPVSTFCLFKLSALFGLFLPLALLVGLQLKILHTTIGGQLTALIATPSLEPSPPSTPSQTLAP